MNGADPHDRYDVAVVGGGHNGLVAAAYLARAGLTVLVLERSGHAGGATVSTEAVAGLPVQVAPYAAFVGALPDTIVRDLDVDLELRPRRVASYTLIVRGGRHSGLLVESTPGPPTADSFLAVTGDAREHDAWRGFRACVTELARAVAPTLLEPLPRRSEVHRLVPGEAWDLVVERALGEVVVDRFRDDAVRGLVAADGLAGSSTDLLDPALEQNRSFLLQQLGDLAHAHGAPGGRRVPVGGMGRVGAALESAARRAGAEICTDAFVTRLDTDGAVAEVGYRTADGERTLECAWVVGNVAPWVLRVMLGVHPGPRPEGAQVRVDMLVDRLPKLRGGVPPELAFAGTLRIGSGYAGLQQAFREAQQGEVPENPPGSLDCPTLTDPSVLGPLAAEGKHLLSWTGLHAPARVFASRPDAQLDETVIRMLDSVDVHLEEPLETLLAVDRDGRPCLRALSPQNVESARALPGGHVFHGPLSWPWAPDPAPLETPAQRWGVQTEWANVLVAGAGAVRGGGVSGIGGHNAAMAVLESVGRRRRT